MEERRRCSRVVSTLATALSAWIFLPIKAIFTNIDYLPPAIIPLFILINHPDITYHTHSLLKKSIYKSNRQKSGKHDTLAATLQLAFQSSRGSTSCLTYERQVCLLKGWYPSQDKSGLIDYCLSCICYYYEYWTVKKRKCSAYSQFRWLQT